MSQNRTPSPPGENDNVIPFPKTMEHHLKEAIQAGQKKKYAEALRHYEQVLRYDEQHLSAKIGLAVTLIETKQYVRAAELTASMLEKEEGDYYHILRIHVAALLQAERYMELHRLLQDLLHKEGLPLSFRSEMESLLEACEAVEGAIVEQEEEEEIDPEQLIRERVSQQPHLVEGWMKQFQEGSLEEQYSALEQLQYTYDLRASKMIREWLKRPAGDPLLKTMGIRALKKKGMEGSVCFYKEGKSTEIELSQFPETVEELPEDALNIKKTIENTTYHEDPVLTQFSTQIWLEYFYTVYPFYPDLSKTNQWASAVHWVTAQRLYHSGEPQDTAKLYGVRSQDMITKAQMIQNALNR